MTAPNRYDEVVGDARFDLFYRFQVDEMLAAGAEKVRVSRANACFQMIQVPGRSYYQTLREKLGWGGNIGGR